MAVNSQLGISARRYLKEMELALWPRQQWVRGEGRWGRVSGRENVSARALMQQWPWVLKTSKESGAEQMGDGSSKRDLCCNGEGGRQIIGHL